jgi:tetratricopeptide (TPR) repeat protein
LSDTNNDSELPPVGRTKAEVVTGHFNAHYEQALSCQRRGDTEQAAGLLEKALAVEPGSFEAIYQLGVILSGVGRKREARKRLERALLIKPGNIETLLVLGRLLVEIGEHAAAERTLQQVLHREPGNIDAHLSLAALEQTRGCHDKARQCYLQALAYHPHSGRLWHALSLHRTWGPQDEEVKSIQAIPAMVEAADGDKLLLAYARGNIHDDLGEYDKAFACYVQANAMQAQQQQYDMRTQRLFFERHKRWQSADKLQALLPVALTDSTPVFVIGMPRSGTSLVEQMLASHPHVVGAGEVDYTRTVVNACEARTGRPFPEDITRVEPGHLATAARLYVQRLAMSAGKPVDGATRVVDKLPHNFLRVGLLATLFPAARFVLCEREPLDVCLSIYRQHFSAAHGYACDLGELGRYYRLYQDLMAYWQEQFPGRLYRVSYEALVTAPETELRGLLAYLELPFEHACLSFHETRRWVGTPSAAQVRRPVYTAAVGHWRHYSDWLAPLRVTLTEINP